LNYFDAHVHCIWTGPFENVLKSWQALANQGLRGFSALIKVNAPKEPERYLQLNPAAYHQELDAGFIQHGSSTHPAVARGFGGLDVCPYLDCRYLSKTDADLSAFVSQGFKGLKILYVPEEDEGMKVVGWRKYFGRSWAESEAVVWSLINQAVQLRWPVLMHVNLKSYRELAEDVLATYPDHPFQIPHFGLSRKIMAGFLERFSTCYTDFASLLPQMRENSRGYRDYITSFQDRILFGTDTTLGHPEWVLEYRNAFMELISDEAVQDKVLRTNYLGFHGQKD